MSLRSLGKKGNKILKSYWELLQSSILFELDFEYTRGEKEHSGDQQKQGNFERLEVMQILLFTYGCSE